MIKKQGMGPNGNLITIEDKPVENIRKQPVVNFFAGPGAGKSSMCADVFSHLKWLDVDVEMVREYAKEKVWEGTSIVLENQIYTFAKQLHRQYTLNNKVDVILTDSPILLSILYDKTANEALYNLVSQQFNQYDNINFFVTRKKKFNPNGRMQTEKEALVKDDEMRAILSKYNVPYIEIEGTPEGAKMVSTFVHDYLSASKKTSQ
jgi:adenylate kinase family enzyme